MFNERKAAQMAAFFLHRRGGRMSHLKLMKLLYLAERESLRQYGMPISGDSMVAMPHGPVLSRTLDLLNGNTQASPTGWEHWVSDKDNYEVSLSRGVEIEELDELSRAELAILEQIWEQFGSMGRWQIRDYTHDHCPEWKDPHGSALPISYKRLLKALGRTPEQITALSDRINTEDDLDNLFASL